MTRGLWSIPSGRAGILPAGENRFCSKWTADSPVRAPPVGAIGGPPVVGAVGPVGYCEGDLSYSLVSFPFLSFPTRFSCLDIFMVSMIYYYYL